MKFVPLAIGMLLGAASASTAGSDSYDPVAGPACLEASLVDSTGVVDDRTILFHMRNGAVWKNTLRQSCANLKFRRGFSEIVRSGEICANKQIISVLGTKNTCQLGDFTLVSRPSP
jgi:hypothetical protein